MAHEWTRGEFRISTDPAALDLDAICRFLADSYWANERPRQVIRRSVEGALPFGLYHGERQVGFARVVTDRATFACLCDLYVDPACRGQGLGKWLLSIVVRHPDLADVGLWLLRTRDAHGLYRQEGFRALSDPEWWMCLRRG
jgi:GNAT superfamily N-acetyltransferase